MPESVTVQQVLAAIGVAICVALLVHQALGAQRRARLARWWRAATAQWRLRWAAWRAGQRRRQAHKAAGNAAREAADVIERARRGAGPIDSRWGADGASGSGDDGRARPVRGASGGTSGGASGGTKGGKGGGAPGGDNVVRPPRFGGRKDLH